MSNKYPTKYCPACGFGLVRGGECDICSYVESVADDVVNRPPHYGNGQIECIDYMKDNMAPEMFMGYLEGNTKKYLHRFRYKGKPVEDLRKARWYLDRLIQEYES